ncbi:MAG: helix-hairpin-helix domain-containing protein [Minisyncoccia bacterium]
MNFRALFLCLKSTQKVGNFFCIFLIILISVLSLVNVTLSATLVNINTADATELDTIPEVGPSTATKIIAYREANGPFSVIEDIMKVTGIKEATFAKMKDFITVGSTSSGTESDEEETGTVSTTSSGSGNATTTTTTTSTTTTEQIVYRYISVHSNAEELSSYNEPTSLEISAGRNRLSYVGMSVKFSAKVKATGSIANHHRKLLWSFGDGTGEIGEEVRHIFKNPGTYNVVLNASSDDQTAVSRVSVKILEPQVSIIMADDNNISVKNHGDYEINLNDWSLSTSGFTYTFPLDTILSAGQTLTVPTEYSKLKINDSPAVFLFDPSHKQKSVLAVNNKNTNVASLSTNISNRNIETEVEKSIAIYRTGQLSGFSNTATTSQNIIRVTNQTQTASVIKAFPNNISTSSEVEAEEKLESFSQDKNESPSPNIFSRVVHWPVKVVGSFVSFFYPGLNSSQ